jgi:hypothetical protein
VAVLVVVGELALVNVLVAVRVSALCASTLFVSTVLVLMFVLGMLVVVPDMGVLVHGVVMGVPVSVWLGVRVLLFGHDLSAPLRKRRTVRCLSGTA